jgi:tetraacyldisaccharide 4'-kinase
VRIDKSHIEDVMYGRRRSLFTGTILRILSIPYGLAVRFRRFYYLCAPFLIKKVAQRVISVGNITLGGTGKTPAVMQIAELLQRHQKKPVVISRGYGRHNESSIVVVSDGNKVLVDAETGGDEPVLIGSKLTDVPVVVCSDRHRAALLAHDKFGNDTVILDDGFQHARLQRDLDIVLIDAADPFGNGRLFPAGILREPLSALRRANAILITHVDGSAELESVKRKIRLHTQARIFTSHQVPSGIVDVVTGEVKPLSVLRDTAVLAFSGIARPAAFTTMLRSLGALVKAEYTYHDHYEYAASDIAAIKQRASNEKAGMIITTEKDAVRIKGLGPAGIWALRIVLNVVENREWEAVLLGTL